MTRERIKAVFVDADGVRVWTLPATIILGVLAIPPLVYCFSRWCRYWFAGLP